MPQEYSFEQRHEIEGRATGNSQLQLEKRALVKSINSLEYAPSYAHFYGYQRNYLKLITQLHENYE